MSYKLQTLTGGICMKKYKVMQIGAGSPDIEKIVGKMEKEGWKLLPPILLQPSIYNPRGVILVIGKYTITFEKEVV